MAQNFYFAWVDEGEAFDADVHAREDEDVFSHSFSHSEGDLAGLDLEIRNPRIGLLNPGRKRWAYYSYRRKNGTVVPLFYGRLLGVPGNIFQNIVQLQFTARPVDFAEQKIALATALKLKPYWDPIFISPDRWDDPDAVLEGYSKLWYINPVTHVVSTSDILIPEDGVVEFGEDALFYDNMGLTLNESPLTKVRMEATIPWQQVYSQNVNLRFAIMKTSAAQFDENYGNLIVSYTMDGLIQDWPKTGASIGSGWTVSLGELTDVSLTNVDIEDVPQIFRTDDIPTLPRGSYYFPIKTTGKFWEGVEGAGFDFQYELVVVALGYGVPFLQVRADAERDYGQRVVFELLADMQDIATAAEDDEALLLTINANRVSDPTEGGLVPLYDPAARDFVSSPRGLEAVEHLLELARVHMRSRARAVAITFEVEFEDVIELSLRKGALIHNDRLPGAEASGKIISIGHALSGDDGACVGTVTMGCAVGYGGAHTADDGEADYCEEDYCDDDYQEFLGAIVLTDATDIAYTVPVVEPGDDGVDFIKGLTPQNVIKSLFVTNNADTQKNLVQTAQLDADGFADQAAVSAVLENAPTQFHLELIDLKTGPHVWDVPIVVEKLILPKQIDLEAPSNG